MSPLVSHLSCLCVLANKQLSEFILSCICIHSDNGILLKGVRIVVPLVLQLEMVAKIYKGHLEDETYNTTSSKASFWPQMNEAQKTILCQTCQFYKSNKLICSS